MNTQNPILQKYLGETFEGIRLDLPLNKILALIFHSGEVSYNEKVRDIESLKRELDSPSDIKLLNKATASLRHLRKVFAQVDDERTFFVIKGQNKVLYAKLTDAVGHLSSFCGKIYKVRLLDALECSNTSIAGKYQISEAVATYYDKQLVQIKGLSNREFNPAQYDIYFPELVSQFKEGDYVRMIDDSDIVGIVVSDGFGDSNTNRPRQKVFRDNKIPVMLYRTGREKQLKYVSIFSIQQVNVQDISETADILIQLKELEIDEYRSQISNLLRKNDDEARDFETDHALGKKAVGIDDVINVVCKHFGLSTDIVANRSRTDHVYTIRQYIIYLARTLAHSSYDEICKALSADHSTIIHAETRVADCMNSDPDVRALLSKLEHLVLDSVHAYS